MIPALLQSESLAYADYFFAKTLIPKEEEGSSLLLAYLLAVSRGGHLCIRKEKGRILPSPSTLVTDPKEAFLVEEKLLEVFDTLPESICSKKESDAPTCLIENKLYLQRSYSLEKKFLFHLDRLSKGSLALKGKKIEVNESLSDEQALAVKQGIDSSFSLISGGPGTGKSFTAIELVRTFLKGLSEEDRKKVKVKLAAPTGKAASLLEKNIMEKLGSIEEIECGTIHSFLKRGSFLKSIFFDLFLIDEASMLDADLFVRFLTSLQPGGRVVFMGDKDQLPPVEAGGFFSDLIEIAPKKGIPVTLLTKSLRVEKKELHALSHAILQGNIQEVKKQKGVEVLSSFKEKRVKEEILLTCLDFFSMPLNEEPLVLLKKLEGFTLLNCMRKGPLGSQNLNTLILEAFLEKLLPGERLACPILVTANDPTRKLMNGEIGLLIASSSSLRKGFYTKEDEAYFFGKEGGEPIRRISGAALPAFDFGYCLSIHKSQGSEYESVMILAPSGSERFGKEILYTAVTRAKKKAKLLIEEATLKSILAKSSRKISGLVD